MDPKTKLYLRQTCTALFDLIAQTNFTICFARSEQLSKMVKVFSRYNKPISLTFTKTISLTPKAVNKLSKLTNLIELSFDITFNDEQIEKEMLGLDQLTNLQRLKFFQYPQYASLFPSLKRLTRVANLFMDEIPDELLASKTNLRELEFFGCQDPTVFQRVPTLTNITSLILRNACLPGKRVPQILTYLSNLKYLDLGTSDLWAPACNLTPVYIGALTNLEDLRVRFYALQDIHNCVGLTNLYVVDLVDSNQQFRVWTTLTKLKKLELDLSRVDEPHDLDLGTEGLQNFYFLSTLTTLQHLTLSKYEDNLPYGIIQCLPHSLTSLSISLNEHRDTDNFTRLVNLNSMSLCMHGPMDYSFLTKLKNVDIFTHFQIAVRSVSDTLTCVTRMTNLKEIGVIGLDGELVYNTDEFGPILRQLPNLEIATIPIISLENVAKMTKLTYLSSSNRITTSNITSELPLRVLQVKQSISHDDEFWQSLKYLPNLEQLMIGFDKAADKSETKAQEARIMSLTVLQHLTNLSLYTFTKISHKCFINLTSLQVLRVEEISGDGKVDRELFTKAQKYLPYLYSYERQE